MGARKNSQVGGRGTLGRRGKKRRKVVNVKGWKVREVLSISQSKKA